MHHHPICESEFQSLCFLLLFSGGVEGGGGGGGMANWSSVVEVGRKAAGHTGGLI